MTTRDALIDAIREHLNPDECPEDCDAACLADALIDVAGLANETLAGLPDSEYLWHDGEWWVRSTSVLTALAAALSPR